MVRLNRKTETEDAAQARRATSRRTLLIGGGMSAALLAIAGRLRFLQVTESDALVDLAERNRVNIALLEPMRGRIFARDGRTVLADNELNYSIMLVREQTSDVETVLRRLSAIIPMSEDELIGRIDEINSHREFVPVLVAENATWKQVAAVAANSPALPGVSTRFGSRRHYPYGSELAHILGYVGPVNRFEQSNKYDRDPLLFVPKFQIGKTGLEKSMDRQLRGSAGNRRIEVNVQGREIRELGRVDAGPGTDVQITIDRKLQNYAIARIGASIASAVVMNVRTGEVLASVSVPSYDPNKFVSGYTVEEFEQLLQTPGSPLVNRPTRGLYPPGSTFKMVVSLAALEAGVIQPDTAFECDGRHEFQNRNFHCWRSGGHGQVALRKGLSESCDVYYYHTAEQVGIDRINRMAQLLGFGIRHSLPSPDVAAGQLPTRRWKLESEGEPWLLGDTLNVGIGQGYVLASTLQLAIMTARIATGLQVEPRLLITVGGTPLTVHPWPQLPVSKSSLDLIRDGMFAATNDRRATAYASRSVDPEFQIAGKTGTSQVRNISEAEREKGVKDYEDLPVRLRDHALYCGYAPYNDPQIAAAVVVENGGSGSKVAAPIVRDLLLFAHFGQLPPLKAYPQELRQQIRQEQRRLLDDRDPANLARHDVSQA